MVKATRESIIERLKERGLKLTPQRRAVIEVLVEKGDLHPGAPLIHEEAKKKKKSLSLSTVYATLNELARYGIIKMLQFDRMENRCEGNIEEHINLICETCKKIVDYEAHSAIDRDEIAKKTGFSVTDARLEYYGYCRDCRAKIEGGS